MNKRTFIKKALKVINLIVVLVMTLGSPFSTFAFVWTDQADYTPGSVVTIHGDNSNFEEGAGYLPGEIVNVQVIGPYGAEYYCNAVTAVDETGYLSWACDITLPTDPALAVGDYTYIATGVTSKVWEEGTFTDAKLEISPIRVNVALGVSFTFTVTGGATPYTFTITDNQSGAAITNTGIYTAGSIQINTDLIDTVRVTDKNGATAYAYVYVGNLGNGETVLDGCMEEVSGDSSLQCTAEDVRISEVTNITILDDGCTDPGDTITFTADYAILSGATERYDIGLYFAIDGDPNSDGALSGSCSISTMPYYPDPPFLDLDGTIAGVQDTCGDIGTKAHSNGLVYNPVYTSVTLTVECQDATGDGYLDLPYCTSWDISNASFCTSPLDAYPGTGSKCSCEEGYSIPIPVPGQIIVDKVTDPSGAATSFDFTLTGSYASPSQTIPAGTVNQTFSLTDTAAAWESAYLYAGTYAVAESPLAGWTPTGVTCTNDSGSSEDPANILLAPAEIVTCTFSNLLNIYSLNVEKSSITAEINAVGQVVPYTFVVTNTGNQHLTGLTVSDPLCDAAPAFISGDADLDAALDLTETWTYTCSHTVILADVAGSYLNNTVTVDSNESEPDTDDYSIPINYVPVIMVEKSSTTTSITAAGQVVPYTFVVTNEGNVPLTGVTVTDPRCDAAPVYVSGDDDIDNVLDLTETWTYTCNHTVTQAEIDAGGNLSNIVTADSNESGPDEDTLDIRITQHPAIDIQKTPDTQTVIYGQTATFTIVVKNAGNVTLSNITVTDPLAPNCAATIPSLAAGAEYSYTCMLENVTSSFTNVATARVTYGSITITDWDAAAVVVDYLPDIAVTKTASPTSVPETGGDVTFTFVVTNNGVEPFILNSLTDTVFGDLDGQGTCTVPQTIAMGGTYTCSITEFLSSDSLVAHTNVVTAAGVDEQGNPDSATDDETVTFTDVAPAILVTKTADPTSVPETGGSVTFTFLVENTGQEDVTLTELTDTVFGNLDGTGTCDVPQTILISGSYSCSITVTLSSDSLTPHTNVVTATTVDDDGTQATDDDDATVTFTDVAPLIQVTKSASPTHVPETGGDVTFTFLVENIGQEDITLSELSDTVFGDLNGQGDCGVPQTILIGESYSCSITVTLSSDSLTPHTNVATATAVDDDGTPATDDDGETVTFDDVAPLIQITKTASPTHVPETGGDATFTFLVENLGQEDVILTSLTDTVFGDLNGQGDCVTGGLIPVGDSYSCSITVFLSSDSLTDHYNISTATAVDDDDTPATDDDDETVSFDDVAPLIQITKTADPTSVPETGGYVTFTFLVENIGAEDVTLTSLTDDRFGDLTRIPGTSCALPQFIAMDESYACAITVFLSSDTLTPHTNVVTAAAVDDDGTTASATDSETVTFIDEYPVVDLTKTASPLSLPEPGGLFTFTLSIVNNSVETVNITALTDTNALSPECLALVGTTLAAGVSTSCTYMVSYTEAGSYLNTANVTVADNEGNTASDSDSETVTVTDVLPAVDLTKTAAPLSLHEPGGLFTFMLSIVNNSVETVNITALTDTNDLSAECQALVGTTLAAGASTSCTYTVSHTEAGSYLNTANVTVADNEGNTASDSDSETVTVTDVLPAVDMTKTAAPLSLPEPGGLFTFMLSIVNNSVETVTITALTDNNALSAECQALIGTSLAAGASTSCTYTVSHTEAGSYPNTANVTVADNEGNTASDSDSETVTVTDVLPAVDLTKTAAPLSLPEPGGLFTFTLSIVNNSVETVTITALTDTNALSAECQALIGTSLAAGASTSCTYTVSYTEAGSYPNTANVTVGDNEGNTASDIDIETVTVTDVLPAIVVEKTAAPISVSEPGGNVVFTFKVTNTSVEPVTIASLSDTDFTLTGDEDCQVGTILPVEGWCEFIQSFPINGDASDPDHENTFTATATDNDGNTATASDSETVGFDDVMPSVTLTKSVDDLGTFNVGDTATFTLSIHNTSPEVVTITTLTDTYALSAECLALIGTSIPADGTVTCIYTVTINIADTYPNTASVTVQDNENNEASAIDDQSVTFYTPQVSKDAYGSYDEVHIWEVTKTVNTGSQTALAGQRVTYTWTIRVDESIVGEDYLVTGDIVIVNPNPDDPMDITLGDALDDGTTATITSCTVVGGAPLVQNADGTWTIPAGSTVTCTYTAEPTGDIEDFAAGLPAQVTINSINPGPDSYWLTTVKGGTPLDGVYEAWCVDLDHTMVPSKDYLANVYSSYEALPAGLIEKPGNMDLVNWLINQNLVGTASPTGLGIYTFGDVQYAIWMLIEDTAYAANGLGTYSLPRVNELFNLATANGEGFIPTCGDFIAVILAPVDTSQPIAIAQVTFASLGLDCATNNTVTAVFNGFEFPAEATIQWNETVINPSATLDDDQNPALPLTVYDDGLFTYADSYTCSTDPAAYTNGTYLFNDYNTATLNSSSSSASTNVRCYYPSIDVTKTADPTAVPETGGNVTFNFVVQNTSAYGPVIITSLFDSVYGTLAGDDDCHAGTVLAAGASCTFSFTAWVEGDFSGPDHVDVFTADASNGYITVSDIDDAAVDFTNVIPTIAVTKTPNVTEVPETGWDVTFTFTVQNTSSEEPMTITSLFDSVYGELDGDADCMVGTVLAAGATCEFSITRFVKGDYESGVAHNNVFTAHAEDNDETDAWDDDDATVTFTNLTASIDVEKYVSIDGGATWLDADTATGPYLRTGMSPLFKFVVENTGDVALTSATLTDTDFDVSSCSVPLPFGVDAIYECIITATWAAGQHTDTATVSGSFVDGAGNTESDSDSDDANYFGAAPSFTVAKDCASAQPIPQEGPAVFNITLTNTGNVALTIIVSEGSSPVTLAAGASTTFSYTVNGPFSGQGTVDNLVSASASYTDTAGHEWSANSSDEASCRVGSRVDLKKTTNGRVDPSMTWTFSIFAGPDGFGGTSLATASTAADVDGVLTFNNLNLDRFQTYTICENAVAAGWTSTWRIDLNGDGSIEPLEFILPYNPNADDAIPNDLGNRCVDFGADTLRDLLTDGGLLHFEVDNTYPGGEPRTPGYWKNWNTCTGGGQAASALANGGWEAGFWLLDDVLAGMGQAAPIVWDDILVDSLIFPIDSCSLGVTVLSAYDIYGNNRNSDGAYTLAKHLLAAQLNYGAGARTCDAASDAMLAAERLLDKYNFNATAASYLASNSRDKTIKADYALALSLAATLDQYNNGRLCLGGPSVSFQAPLDGVVVSGDAVTLWVDAYDTAPVIKVDFYLDGATTPFATDTDGSDLWSVTWDSTLVPDGSHTITAVATNAGLNTGSADVTFTVDNVPDPVLQPISIASLVGSKRLVNSVTWEASVIVTVQPALANAVVTGSWSNGATGTCTTDATGRCTILLGGLSVKKLTSVTFTVTGISQAGYLYDASLNLANSVTVTKP